MISDEHRFRDLYCNIMEEIKKRIDIISDIENKKIAIPKIVAFELCYLQLRYICELIAIASFAAHSEIGKSRDNIKNYNVDKIIKRLSRLHPDFYPVPTRQIIDPKTDRPIKTVPIDKEYLTKEKLLSLYGECGDVLHRGSLKKILTSFYPKKLDFDKIYYWRELIVQLLNHHQIQLLDKNMMFWVLMKSKGDGRVHGAVMVRQDAT